jgi:hypothetical protein
MGNWAVAVWAIAPKKNKPIKSPKRGAHADDRFRSQARQLCRESAFRDNLCVFMIDTST